MGVGLSRCIYVALKELLFILRYHPFLLFPEQFPPRKLGLSVFVDPYLILIRSTQTRVDTCPGVPLIWDADDPLAIFSSYPWTRHAFKDNKMDFLFPTANYKDGKIVGFDIRSTSCTSFLYDNKPCLYCRRLTSKVNNLRKLSKQPAGRLNYNYQSHEQLMHAHSLKNEMIKDLQLSVCSRFQISIGLKSNIFGGEYESFS